MVPSQLRQRGFTLLELLVVLVILGLLAGFVAPKFFKHIGHAEVQTTRDQVDALEKALDQYRIDVGHYPSTEQGLAALMERPGNESRWQGPYLRRGLPKDPWGNAYQYRFPGEKNEFDVFSFGKDGQVGGAGDAADIGNW